MRFTLLIMLVLAIAFGGLAGCQKAAVSPAESPAATSAKTPEEAPRISLADAKKAFDESKTLFIDTRVADQYKADHIKGAINIPAGEFETRYAEVPKDKKVITYCS